MCDGSVQFVSDDVETTGLYGDWGSVWDHMICSADGGTQNGVVGGKILYESRLGMVCGR